MFGSIVVKQQLCGFSEEVVQLRLSQLYLRFPLLVPFRIGTETKLLDMAAICSMLLLLFLLSPFCSCGFSRRKWEGMLKAPPRPKGVEVAAAQWFQQKLDHFNSSDARTWKQRYFVNDTNWDRSYGPVFLMLGGEGEADPIWLAINTDMMRNAEKYKALAVMIEHRYYGQSHPTPNVSTENLKYLSSRQALEDVATFYEFFSQQYNLTSANKWVSFGGSYSGALSGWLRLKHPEIVVGAVATSGPVQAVVDFSQYLEVVNDSLATSSAGVLCDNYISDASHLLHLLVIDRQWKELESLFHVDPPLQSSMDIEVLTQTLIGNFMNVVQYNRDNTAFEGRPNNITLDDLCAIMTNSSILPVLDRFAAVNDLLLNSSGIKTINASFQGQVNSMSQVDWDAPTNMGERQWTYQTCTEFGYFQTTDSTNQPFGNFIPLDYYTKLCSLVFDVSVDSITAAVAATNVYYGGKDIPKNTTNIVFPNGSIDPWHALGITESISDSLIALFIKGTAHCANMYPPRDGDLPELNVARELISQYIALWLSE